MLSLLTLVATVCMGAPQRADVPDPEALGSAFAHARAVIPEGTIQVSPDTVPEGVELPLEEAARVAGPGFVFGPDREAVRCGDRGACYARGAVRGLVHVFEYRSAAPDSVIVTLRVLRFTPRPERHDLVYEQVDEVHVTRSGAAPSWRIQKVVRISET